MVATFFDSDQPPHGRPSEWTPRTVDLDPTVDVNGEDTSDLAPRASDAPPETPTSATLDTQDAHTAFPAPPPAAAPRRSQLRKAAPARPLAPGDVLVDRYLIEAELGDGGVATIYRARDMHSSSGTARNMQIAIKCPRPELHDRERARIRITHEYTHTRALSHPHIVRVFDLHADAELSFMTMELIDGAPLSTFLRRRSPAPAALAHRILQGCGQALAHAHGRGVVHGDFKPGNAIITREDFVKVIDFGAASAPASAESRIAAGTPAYASPQVLSGETPEARDDIFSFACVAYELLTGQHPFDRRSSLEARDAGCVPPRVWALSGTQWLALLAALSWRREGRPTDIDSLVAALAPVARRAPPPGAASVEVREPAPHEFPEDLMPKPRSWGFFVFLACALSVTYLAFERQGDSALPAAAIITAPSASEPPPAPQGVLGAVPTDSAGAASPFARPAGDDADAASASTQAATATSTAPAASGAAARKAPSAAVLSEIAFASGRIVTTEGSVAAVFLITRSPPLSGRVGVKWEAISGTATAGADFAVNAAGAVELADNQAQRAIYVPLHDDIMKEGDETFTVRLTSPTGARLGKVTSAEATIRDDD